MATCDLELETPPTDDYARQLWLQQAAGLILFEDVRKYAAKRLAPALDEASRDAALKAIDDAVYGLMMVLDGVTGRFSNSTSSVSLRVIVQLHQGNKVTDYVDLLELGPSGDRPTGDGMCKGYNGWREGDFGKAPIARGRKP